MSSELKLPQIVPDTFAPHWVEGMPAEAYHAEKSAVSSGGCRAALRSALAFRRLICEGLERRSTPALQFGTIAHLAILEPTVFRDRYVAEPDFGDLRFKESKVKRGDWLNALPPTAVVVKQEELDRLRWMIDSLVDHPVASNLLKGAAFEASGFFRDPVSGLKCRIRPDVLRLDNSALPDLKTTRDITREGFARQIWNHRYDVQMAFYCFGVEQIIGKPPEVPAFIAIENVAPYEVAVYTCDEGMMSRGAVAVRKGLDRIAEAITTGTWPGYQPGAAEDIGLPAYTDYLEE
jgi:hypothetical protein